MKKLSITKESFEKSKYFTNKYGKLEYVSESGKVFKTSKGKILMFKESRVKPTLLTKEEVNVIDKVADESKIDWFQLNPGKLGGWFVFDTDDEEYMSVNDGLDELCQGACNGDWAELFGLTPEEIDVWNNLVKKLNLDPHYMAQATLNESVGNISKDPAYVCPYCGSHDCEFDDANDFPSEGYFDGATFNAQFWCNECNKPYNVTYELKVKDVYPNEDLENLEDEDI